MSHIAPNHVYKGQTPHELRSGLSDPHLIVGIDWLTVSFPCPRQSSFTGWHSKTWKRGATTTATQLVPFHPSIQGGPHLRLVYVDSPHSLATYVSFNPSRVIDPTGTSLASTQGATYVLNTIVVPMIPAFLRPPPTANWDLYRVDLAVDVETGGHTQQVLRDLESPMHRPQHHTYTYLNGPGILGTVGRRSVTRPRVTVYDKAAESKSPPPRVRFEVQYRRDAARADFAGKLIKLDEDSARAAFQSELGPIAQPNLGGGPKLAALYLSEADLKTAYEMLGIRAANAAGVYRPPTQSASRRYKRFLKEHSVTSIEDLL